MEVDHQETAAADVPTTDAIIVPTAVHAVVVPTPKSKVNPFKNRSMIAKKKKHIKLEMTLVEKTKVIQKGQSYKDRLEEKAKQRKGRKGH